MRIVSGSILICAAVVAVGLGAVLDGASWYTGDLAPVALMVGGGLLGALGAALMTHGAVLRLKSDDRPMYHPPAK